MIANFALLLALLLSSVPTTASGHDAQDREFWNWLIEQSDQVDSDQLSPHRAISSLLEIANACHAVQKQELANKYFQRTLTVARNDERSGYHFALFAYAIETDQIQLAEKIAKESKVDALLDRYDLEKYRRGDRDAIKNYPRKEMTFYNAMELANVFIDLGEYDRAEEFVTAVKITEENDPEDVAGIALETIAKKFREKGDMENARRYIDKAKAIAGNQFYTGYAINVTHRSMHGTLTDDLERFARRGAAYRGHMGRELIRILVSELVRSGLFQEAKKASSFLEKPEEVRKSLQYVAIQQAKLGDMVAALESVEELEDAQTRNAARLGIAEVLAAKGKADSARKLADFVLRSLGDEIDKEAGQTYRRLAYLYGNSHSRPQLEQLIERANTSLLKANCISSAIKGFADAAE